jgi:flagellar motor switch protein FliN/FliY
MADTDETAQDDSTPGDAPGVGSPDLGASAEAQDAVHEALIEVWAVLGKVSIPIRQLLKMGRGAVIALDRALDEPIEIRANNHLIARADVVIVEEMLGVSITENVAADTARKNR